MPGGLVRIELRWPGHRRGAPVVWAPRKVRVVLAAVNDRTREAFDRDEQHGCSRRSPSSPSTRPAPSWPRWVQVVDQEGVDPKPPRHAEVRIRSTFDGWFDLQGRLDPELGARVAAAIRAHAEKLFRGGSDERAEGHRHTQAERQALALGDLIDRAVDPAVTSTRVPPSAVVVINLADLQADDGGIGEVAAAGASVSRGGRRGRLRRGRGCRGRGWRRRGGRR